MGESVFIWTGGARCSEWKWALYFCCMVWKLGMGDGGILVWLSNSGG